jgi:hypothetical protein
MNYSLFTFVAAVFVVAALVGLAVSIVSPETMTVSSQNDVGVCLELLAEEYSIEGDENVWYAAAPTLIGGSGLSSAAKKVDRSLSSIQVAQEQGNNVYRSSQGGDIDTSGEDSNTGWCEIQYGDCMIEVSVAYEACTNQAYALTQSCLDLADTDEMLDYCYIQDENHLELCEDNKTEGERDCETQKTECLGSDSG